MKIIPKNWASFQHYKDRAPPWIKLHKGLIDDRKYQSLPIASRALAPMLWLLASESKDGSLDADPAELAFRLRATEKEINQGLAPLIAAGFFIEMHLASNPQAECSLDATPEERREETETEGSAEPPGDSPPAPPRPTIPTDPAVVSIPLVDGTEYPITAKQIEEWATCYPAVDVLQELREMRTWSQANPTNRKTVRGVNAFVVRWLGKEQDKGGRVRNNQSTDHGVVV